MTSSCVSRTPVVYKVSGESLSSSHGGIFTPISPDRFRFVADEVTLLHREGYAPCVVVGGGNIFRGGNRAESFSIDPDKSDRAGMRATSVNADLLAAVIESSGIPVQVMTRGDLGGVEWNTDRACQLLSGGSIVILAGGMGVPRMSSDFPAVYHAGEIGASAVLVAKHGVDAVFTDDPKRVTEAVRLNRVTCTDAINSGLGFMDTSALEAARERSITLMVFSAEARGAGLNAIENGRCGTVVEPI